LKDLDSAAADALKDSLLAILLSPPQQEQQQRLNSATTRQLLLALVALTVQLLHWRQPVPLMMEVMANQPELLLDYLILLAEEVSGAESRYSMEVKKSCCQDSVDV
jgi:hypothetical protein